MDLEALAKETRAMLLILWNAQPLKKDKFLSLGYHLAK